jgi:hypothetical protein
LFESDCPPWSWDEGGFFYELPSFNNAVAAGSGLNEAMRSAIMHGCPARLMSATDADGWTALRWKVGSSSD